ncbi:MAG: 3'-5' exoribonuclease [Burkholderiaceae bacterium]|nr:3'-5' exoribonuclease [Burkholderiaceae bacterium]
MTRVFFDTEFEGLFPGAKLISIGFVTEDDATFYAELTDTYSTEACGQFCRKFVLPLLDGGDAETTLEQLRVDLRVWLESLGKIVTLICDSPRDVAQLDFIFPNGLPAGCQVHTLGYIDNWRRRILNFRGRLHKKNGFKAHHALHDAQVNKIIFT